MKSTKLVLCSIGLCGLTSTGALAAGYQGAPRTELFNPSLTSCIRDTSAYKKAPPYVIGFSNAGLGDSWRVVALDELKQGAQDHKDVIKKLIITDAGHDDAKQVSDVQDLTSQGVDLLIVSANTEKALDPVVTRAMKRGVPVIMLDRRISSDHFVTYINASDPEMGRLWAQWIVEKLHGKGNVVMLGGQAGSSPNENRMGPALEIFKQYPGIHNPRHGLFRLEPGRGQAGHAGGDREIRPFHQCRLVGAWAAGARLHRGLRRGWVQAGRDPDAHHCGHQRRAADGDQVQGADARGGRSAVAIQARDLGCAEGAGRHAAAPAW